MPSVTINFSAEHATRIQLALEESMRLVDENDDPRPATTQDLKDYVMADVKQFVKTSERRVARKAADLGIANVDLS